MVGAETVVHETTDSLTPQSASTRSHLRSLHGQIPLLHHSTEIILSCSYKRYGHDSNADHYQPVRTTGPTTLYPAVRLQNSELDILMDKPSYLHTLIKFLFQALCSRSLSNIYLKHAAQIKL
jgi:hypothetical protein